MRAVICSRFDGIEALELGELPDPVPAPGEVVVDVHTTAPSFMDTLMVAGRYQMKPALPFVPGSDAAGVVLAVGDGVRHVRVGDRVACSHWYGGWAERWAVPAASVVPLPDRVGFEVGTTVRHAYGTARYALVTRAQLQPGETVFVSGAAGGVGLAAVDVARVAGATVIAGASSAARCDVARRQGAAHAIDCSSEPVRERLLELTSGRGVDVFFDNVGGPLFGTVSRAMAWGGRVLPIGFTSGEIPSLAMNLPLLKNYSVVGCFWGPWMAREPHASRAADEALFAAVAAGTLRPQVSDVLPLSSFAEGLRRLANREVTGRLVLRVGQRP
ncbi:NADPH:quinone oxidoreductase family protein [Piscinibacter gummiphilus]|uniref:Quinone oxidoreductase n=1 Tax=Piscinibacter gummiphilus TaxID=946333 RepID=A0A1W6LB97_9BURK|nr:NADPH:quinone oxidoreductase family protein [Piscinibacter gummiphilus]ARN21539.1 quinone oxidoreductase [Piscinibacter gummiphilus]ATU66225.1 NADPH:quinone oxidoreductase family protein [Piscinibacter gummiphilus]GLS97806.1 quinone oxidoreductase [Piscinibacter gummiphilus]